MIQQQQIHQQQPQSETQAQIQYYVYQDLQNVINLLYSMKAVIQHFEKNSNHPMVTICNNKLMLQLNISFGIHLDQLQQFQNDKKNYEFLIIQRNNAQNILESIIQSMNQNEKELLREQLNKIEHYKINCLGSKFQWNQYQLKITNQNPKFNEQVVQQIINSIQQVDDQVTHISKNTNSEMTIEQIQKKAQQFEKKTYDQLNHNFPNPNFDGSSFKTNDYQFNSADQQNIINHNTFNPQNSTQRVQQNNSIINPNQSNQINSKVITEQENQLLIQILCNFQEPIHNSKIQKIVQSIESDYQMLKQQILNYSNLQQLIYYYEKGHLLEQFKYYQIFVIFYHYLQQTRLNRSMSNNVQFQSFLQSYSYINNSYYYFTQYLCNSKYVIDSKHQYTQQINNNKVQIKDEYIYLLFNCFLLLKQVQNN